MSKRKNQRLFITAATAKQTGKDCHIIAYTGGLMTVPGWGLIGIELSGLDTRGQIKLLADHDSSLRGVAGFGKAVIEGTNLTITGKILDTSKGGEDIVELSQAGFQFEASVGIDPQRVEYINADQESELNGKKIKSEAAWTKVIEGTLREVSITSLGCDSDTVVSIAAKYEGDKNQNSFEKEKTMFKKLQAAATQYADVIPEPELNQLLIQAMDSGMDETAFTSELNSRTKLIALRASRPQIAPKVNAGMSDSLSEPAQIRAAGVAGLMVSTGNEAAAVKVFGEKIVVMARRMDWANPTGILRAALLLGKQPIPNTTAGLIKAAFSSVDLPVLLGDSLEKSIGFEYLQRPQTWRGFTKIKTLTNFRPHPQANASLDVVPLLLGPTGEVKHTEYQEESMPALKADTYTRQIRISRQMFKNDDLGIFSELPQAFAMGSVRAQSDLLYQVILNNAGSFFSAANLNLILSNPLSIDNIAVAVAAFRGMVDLRGYPVDIDPKYLVVAPGNETIGRQIVQSTEVARYVSSALDNRPTGNKLPPLELVVEARLDNAKFPGSVAGDWYLAADKVHAPVVMGYIDGIETPQIEYFGLDSNIDTLGYGWRVTSDFGAALVNSKAIVKSIVAAQ